VVALVHVGVADYRAGIIGWLEEHPRCSPFVTLVLTTFAHHLFPLAPPRFSHPTTPPSVCSGAQLALVAGGLRVADMELEVMLGGADRLANELRDHADGPTVKQFPGQRLWYPFRAKCWDWAQAGKAYQFCPFKEVTVDGRSFGKVFSWGRFANGTMGDASRMTFTGGDPTNCPGFRPRSATVEMACGGSYGLVAVKESSCALVLTFKSPLGCEDF